MIHNTTFMTSLFSVVLGCLGLFWGYRLFPFVLSLCGAVVFGMIGDQVATNGFGPGYLHIAIVVGFAFIGAILARFIYLFGLLLFGASLGLTFAPWITAHLPTLNPLILMGIVAVGGALLIKILERPVIIVLTVLIGAGNVVSGGTLFLTGNHSLSWAPTQSDAVISNLYSSVTWAALVATGLLVQFFWSGTEKNTD